MARVDFDNVVVFGDSLSDIGIKWTHFFGKVALGIGAMTVNSSGRFSDCRNWTDFMYEHAAGGGQSLIKGSKQATIDVSSHHQKLKEGSLVTPKDKQPFFYANYAVGGACGAITSTGLTPFKEQIEGETFHDGFRGHFRDLQDSKVVKKLKDQWGRDFKKTLFLIWFGANDLFTAKCKPAQMAAVAEKIAKKRRNELAAIVGKNNAKFIFMNLAKPLSCARFQSWERKGKIKKKQGYTLDQLDIGVDLFNSTLTRFAKEHAEDGDAVVNIERAATSLEINTYLGNLGLLPYETTHQVISVTHKNKTVTKDMEHWKKGDYSDLEFAHNAFKKGVKPMLRDVNVGVIAPKGTGVGSKGHLTEAEIRADKQAYLNCSDKVHPTEIIYKHLWLKILEKFTELDYHFGHI